MVRVYISVDMEGVAGISHAKPTNRGDDLYPMAVELMVGEANAAVEGAFDGGATEVTVNDSHGAMYNLTPERMDPRARLVQGKKPWSMVEAARESSFDVALFVGYHARAGHPRGTIAHTYTGKVTLAELDGRPVTEAGMNAVYLGALGIPVGMVTGDDALAEEMVDWLPWAETVVVKRGVSWQAADSVHPSRARDMIRAAAQRTVEKVIGRCPGHEAAGAARRRSTCTSISPTLARPTSPRRSRVSSGPATAASPIDPTIRSPSSAHS